jgi:hypothetical protein
MSTPTGPSPRTPIAEVQRAAARMPVRKASLVLTRTSELKAPKATILAYAPARWGKTYSIRTCLKPLVLATEMGDTLGLLSLSDLDIPFIKIENSDHMLEVARQLTMDNCVIEGERYETVVPDSLTHLGEQWLEAGAKAMGWDDVWLTKAAGKDPRNAYPYVAEKGRKTMKALFAIPAHLYCIAREQVVEIQEGKDKIQYVAPELPGQKLPRELPGWPDATLHGVLLNGKRLFRTRSHNRAVAGIRVPGGVEVPEYIVPNVGAICRLMVGDLNALKELEVPKPAAIPQRAR